MKKEKKCAANFITFFAPKIFNIFGAEKGPGFSGNEPLVCEIYTYPYFFHPVPDK